MKIYLNSCGERHQNLAIFLRENIILLRYDTFPSISVFDITKNSFPYDIIRIILVYRSPQSPNSSLASFCNTLETFFRCYCIDSKYRFTRYFLKLHTASKCANSCQWFPDRLCLCLQWITSEVLTKQNWSNKHLFFWSWCSKI